MAWSFSYFGTPWRHGQAQFSEASFGAYYGITCGIMHSGGVIKLIYSILNSCIAAGMVVFFPFFI